MQRPPRFALGDGESVRGPSQGPPRPGVRHDLAGQRWHGIHQEHPVLSNEHRTLVVELQSLVQSGRP
jgi:hypothetical protein